MENTKWLIWSNEHNGWWKPNSMGYCRDRKDAGRFDYKEACEIVENANYGLETSPHEAMVLDV